MIFGEINIFRKSRNNRANRPGNGMRKLGLKIESERYDKQHLETQMLTTQNPYLLTLQLPHWFYNFILKFPLHVIFFPTLM